jgi:hypothetical protein
VPHRALRGGSCRSEGGDDALGDRLNRFVCGVGHRNLEPVKHPVSPLARHHPDGKAVEATELGSREPKAVPRAARPPKKRADLSSFVTCFNRRQRVVRPVRHWPARHSATAGLADPRRSRPLIRWLAACNAAAGARLRRRENEGQCMSTVTTTGAPQPDEDALYPTRDGQPMAETELHGDEMTELKLMLRRHFEPVSDRTYLGCNLFVYYEEGNPAAVFSPERKRAEAERKRAEAERERAETERERAETAERRLAELLAELEKRR